MKTHLIKAMLALIFVLLTQTDLFAQAEDFKNSTPEERANFQTEWMKEELSLDSTIIKSVHAINLKYSKKNTELMKSGGSKISKLKGFKSSSKEKDKELKNIFSKEQYDIYQKKKEEMQELLRERIQEKRNKK